jgi:hypothetical protein
MHLEAGLENPLEANFELSMIKRGVSRQLSTPLVQMLPIDVPILKKLALVYELSRADDICFWAALMVGFYGMLRKSSLLPKFSDSPPEMGLCRSDLINMTADGFVLVVRHSKTNQFGRRTHQLPFIVCDDVSVCPVRAVLKHLVTSKLPPSANLFSYVQDGRSMTLNHSSFVAKMRRRLSVIGLNPGLYSAHSLRRGGGVHHGLCGRSLSG